MDFRDRMASRYASELDVLWADFQVAVAALPETLPPDGRPLLPKSTLGEYLRAEKEILRRSGLLDGDVVSMGSDELWQLGDPDHVRDIDEKLAAYPPLLVRTLLEKDVRQVSAGGLHSLALDSDGVPYSWGCPDNGAIGRETPEDPLHDTCLSEATPSPVAGFTTVTGVNEDGTICQIAAGKSHSLFLSQAGNVYVCGYYKDNESGE
jgi:regulator of chromosome condensation